MFPSNHVATTTPTGIGLRANPNVHIEVGDDIVDVHAADLQGAERTEKYLLQAERYPGFAEYQRMTPRTIPVVALTPTRKDCLARWHCSTVDSRCVRARRRQNQALRLLPGRFGHLRSTRSFDQLRSGTCPLTT